MPFFHSKFGHKTKRPNDISKVSSNINQLVYYMLKMYCMKPWTKHIFFQKKKLSQKYQQ